MSTPHSPLPISLATPRLTDLDELLAFELENRSFFESRISARPAAFYSRAGLSTAIESAEAAAQQDQAYQFLIRNEAGRLIGRINLTRVRRDPYHAAELGYRIGAADNGRGYAQEAVRQILLLAEGELQLRRLEATAQPENLGSMRVLQRNGFAPYGRSARSFYFHGSWHDLLHYERRLGDAPTPTLTPPLAGPAFTRRPATPGDLPFLRELRQRTMGPHLNASGLDSSSAAHEARIRLHFETAEILMHGDAPAGLLKLVRRQADWELLQLQLDPAWQGRGAGAGLLAQLTAEADAAGATLRLSVLKVNPARRLYERFGFTLTGQTDSAFEMLRPPAAAGIADAHGEEPADLTVA